MRAAAIAQVRKTIVEKNSTAQEFQAGKPISDSKLFRQGLKSARLSLLLVAQMVASRGIFRSVPGDLTALLLRSGCLCEDAGWTAERLASAKRCWQQGVCRGDGAMLSASQVPATLEWRWPGWPSLEETSDVLRSRNATEQMGLRI